MKAFQPKSNTLLVPDPSKSTLNDKLKEIGIDPEIYVIHDPEYTSPLALAYKSQIEYHLKGYGAEHPTITTADTRCIAGIGAMIDTVMLTNLGPTIDHVKAHPNDLQARALLEQKLKRVPSRLTITTPVMSNERGSITYDVEVVQYKQGTVTIFNNVTITATPIKAYISLRADCDPWCLRYFTFDHLPEGELRNVSEKYAHAAYKLFNPCVSLPADTVHGTIKRLKDDLMVLMAPFNHERSAGLKKLREAFAVFEGKTRIPDEACRALLEAKDCAVRALLPVSKEVCDE